MPEGNGLTLYRFVDGVRGRDCGRLNTDATQSTHDLGELYNNAEAMLRERDALRAALMACEARITDAMCLRAGGGLAWTICRNQARAALAEGAKP
jgi:hypothetical protein